MTLLGQPCPSLYRTGPKSTILPALSALLGTVSVEATPESLDNAETHLATVFTKNPAIGRPLIATFRDHLLQPHECVFLTTSPCKDTQARHRSLRYRTISAPANYNPTRSTATHRLHRHPIADPALSALSTTIRNADAATKHHLSTSTTDPAQIIRSATCSPKRTKPRRSPQRTAQRTAK
ncbi:hypothetical protein LTR28_009092, partial [Elasticomyces elasticus]